MKAIVCTAYGEPEVLQLQDVAKPVPGKRDLLIRIHATTVTASDCIMRGMKAKPGLYRFIARAVVGFNRPRHPVLGLVFAGEIESTGSQARSYKPGDAVLGWATFPKLGAYAEYISLPEKKTIVHKPSNLTYEEAAAIPYGGLLSLYFLRLANIQNGQNVLIYGASGANGTAAVQLAKSFGASVTGVCSAANMEMVRSLGAERVIDYTAQDFVSQGVRYDLIFDAVGKRKFRRSKEDCLPALAAGGKVVSVDDKLPSIRVQDLAFLKDLVEAGKMKPVIDRIFPLEEMVEAHRYVDQGHKKGNVIIRVS